MARMIVVGPEAFRLPFSAIGFEPVEATEATFIAVLRRVLADPLVGLVVCGESLAASVPADEFVEVRRSAPAAVLVVPDGPDVRHTGYNLVRRSIERAAGVDLLGPLEAEGKSAQGA